MHQTEVHTKFWKENLNKRDYGKVILKWISNRIEKYGLEAFGSEQGPVIGSCELCKEFLCSVKFWEYPE
jgi:hypothetical protein